MNFEFDKRLLCFFEKIGHAFQRFSGSDNFLLGWVFFWSSFFTELHYLLSREEKEVFMFSFNITMTIVVFVVIATMLKFAIDHIKSILGSRCRNPLEKAFIGVFFRLQMLLFFLVFVIFFIFRHSDYDLWKMIDAGLTVISWYFFCCTPLPPEEVALDPGLPAD